MSEQASRESEVLVVEVGHEELEHGRVRAELRGDGVLLVEKLFEGKAQQFERPVDRDLAAEVLRSGDDLARVRSERRDYRPVPDEARYEIEIRRQGEEPLRLEVWQNELDGIEAAGRLIRSLAEQVELASDGQAVL